MSFIEGQVLDIQGEPLPGVAVRVEENEKVAVTNALGAYRLASGAQPGDDCLLQFYKTGYTSGRLQLTVQGKMRTPAAPVELWPLPASRGVYLYEDYKYNAATPIEREEYRSKGRGTVYGINRSGDCATENTEPLIICYKMPKYDVRLSKLQSNDVTLWKKDQEIGAFKLWTEQGTVPFERVQIDAIDELLMAIKIRRPLDEGVYAVHWGVLAGQSASEQRLHCFSVEVPDEEMPADVSEQVVTEEMPELTQKETGE